MRTKIKDIIVVILIVIFTFSIVPKCFQNDTFYIMKLGDYIIQNGIDRVDHFSWHDNLEYRYPHWLFDVINSLIYSSFGLDGIYVFVCLMASILMILIYFSMQKKNINWYIAFVSTLIISYLMKDGYTARGQIISYIMFFLEINLIESFLKNKNKLSVLGLVIVSCIIANVHATAWVMFLILFLPYIGEYFVSLFTLKNVTKYNIKRTEKKLEKLRNIEEKDEEKIKYYEEELKHYKEFLKDYKERKNNKITITKNDNAKWLILVAIIASLGAFITPLGDIPFTYVLRIGMGNSTSYISEHLPTVIATNLELFSFLIVFIAFFAFTDSKMKLSDAFLLVGLLIMAISSKRNIYLLLSLATIPLIKMIDEFVKKNLIEDEILYKTIDVLFIITCIASIGISGYEYYKNYDSKYIDEVLYPVRATEWLKNNLDVNNIKLFNDYDYGSYLLWQDIPVFIDSRCDLYTEQFNKDVTVFNDYMEVYSGQTSYTELFKKYNIDYALVYKNSTINVYMKEDSKCQELYSDDNFVIYKYEQ